MTLDSQLRATRRDALKFGGLTVSLGALVAACGEDRGGADSPGRVGNAPAVTALPNYEVDDSVYLRTASSLEFTAVDLYEKVREFDVLPGDIVDRLRDDHQSIGDRMVALTIGNGGQAWTCANPWFTERYIEPVLASITSGDRDPADVDADVYGFAIVFENLAAASHQQLASTTGISEARIAHVEAAALEARHGSKLAIDFNGADNYISPAVMGEEVVNDDRGGIPQFAIPSTFAETAQIDFIAGPPDENGVRETFSLQTPSLNSLIYNEFACDV